MAVADRVAHERLRGWVFLAGFGGFLFLFAGSVAAAMTALFGALAVESLADYSIPPRAVVALTAAAVALFWSAVMALSYALSS